MALKFETNVQNELKMRSLTGELVDSQFGGQQFRFVTDAGAFYVSEPVGAILQDRFAALGVTAGETVGICKREVVRGGRKSIQWEVERIGDAPAEEPSMLERQLAASLAEVAARKAPVRAAAPGPAPAALIGWQQTLLNQTQALTDVYAAALAYASERHGNAVKPEDIRNMMTTAFIGLQKGGGQRAA